MSNEEVEVDQELINEMSQKSVSEIKYNTQLLENNIRISERTLSSLSNKRKELEEHAKQNKEIISRLKQTPYLISSVVETLKLVEGDDEDIYQGSGEELSAVIKTSRRETVFLPISGLLKAADLEPSELVAVSRDTYTIYEKLPPHYDSRVKAMEVDSKPTETYEQCGGLDKQIQELKEAIVLPLMEPERLKKIGIQAPKGVLLYGPPGTGKTMLARACAANTNSTFLRLAGPQLVQKYVGEGAKIVREAFELARSKAPTIIFIDEIDAVGGKRNDSDNITGEREVSRTMLELLNQLDGFTALDNVKVICATNRPDVLDPALLRSGRLDRKIELPMPNEDARVQILEIHSKNMKTDENVNFREIARSTEDFNGAMLKAVCVEAGMVALRRNADVISHEDYVEGIAQVQAKKKKFLNYFS
ncbi:Rpt5p [Histomonas meleagridis]|uniref:Rpt5p n=1 Tax=Histomonas meleagridis TaxID=135588 RepID=UPI00355A9E41|nr:Rpt5p [Histomonas meleagridis]KAH0806113.1 Rpt5p [Histomonas meleagridis]